MRTVIGLLLAMTIGVPAARAEATTQQWLTFTGDVRIDRNDNLYGVAILRTSPDEFKLAQRALQLGWRHRLASKATLIISIAHYTSFRDKAPARIEARLSQGIAVPVATIAAGRAEGRLLIEEIIVRGSGDVGLRGRPRLKWSHKLSGNGKVDFQLTDEAILALNSTDAGQRAGLVANRASVGARFALSQHFGILPYYTWQHVNRIATADRDDHILGLTIDASF